MHALLAENSGIRINTPITETMAAVTELTASMSPEEGTTADKVAKKLKLGRSAGLRRLRQAADAGFVVNLEEKRGRPGRYRLTGQVVEVEEMLKAKAIAGQRFSGCAGPCNHLATGRNHYATRLQPPLQPPSH